MRLVVLVFALLLVPAARAAEVRGVVRFTGAVPERPPLVVTKDRNVCGDVAADESFLVSDGGLANVVVRIAVPGARGAPRRVTLDQQRCRFVPHVLAVPTGSTLEMVNGDRLLHGVHGWSGVVTAFNVAMPGKGDTRSQLLSRPGVIQIGCDMHGWMGAWVVVLDGPHHAVSDGKGRFVVPDVPPGTYTVTAWHERLGERLASVTVPAEGAATLQILYP